MSDQSELPSRLHHTAYVTRDLEATRLFYEDLLGFPLIATWCESDELFGAVRTYCHCFFGIGDGGALAFSNSRSPRIKNSSDRKCRPPRFIISRSNAMPKPKAKSRSGSQPRAIESQTASSLSMDTARRSMSPIPIELTVDAPHADRIAADRRNDAHSELRRWLAGDHTSNNSYR